MPTDRFRDTTEFTVTLAAMWLMWAMTNARMVPVSSGAHWTHDLRWPYVAAAVVMAVCSAAHPVMELMSSVADDVVAVVHNVTMWVMVAIFILLLVTPDIDSTGIGVHNAELLGITAVYALTAMLAWCFFPQYVIKKRREKNTRKQDV